MHLSSAPITILALFAGLASAALVEDLVPRRHNGYTGGGSGGGSGGYSGTPTTTTPTTATTYTTVCACINAGVTFKVSGHNCGAFASEICTCVSVADQFVTANTNVLPPITEGVRYAGHNATVSALERDLEGCEAKDKHTCTFPVNSTPSCTRQNLCDYTCNAGTVPCNGECKATCPTGTYGSPSKRNLDYWGQRVQKSCRPGWSACGVPGGGPRDWECIDIANDLESCGGCTGALSSLTRHSDGIDCTSIPHVSDVSCLYGGCAVHRCLPGYKIALSGDSCEADESSSSPSSNNNNDNAPTSDNDSVLDGGNFFRNTLQAAAAFGLDHIPFHKH